MVKRTVSAGDDEPTQVSFQMPSEKEHQFQVVDIFDNFYERNKFNLDPSTVIAKLEVVDGEESGRTLLNRCNLDASKKDSFNFTRKILKALGEEYKGEIVINTDNWVGKRLYATVVHNKSKDGTKTYPNIAEYNFEKKAEQVESKPTGENVQWDE